MVDLAGVPPFGGGGVNTRPVSDTPAPAVPAVEAASAGQSLSGRMSSNDSGADGGAGQQGADQQAHPPARKPVDPNALAGPPPSFQVSLLEMDRDLSQALARLNAHHAIDDATSIANPPAPQPQDNQAGGDAEKSAEAGMPDKTEDLNAANAVSGHEAAEPETAAPSNFTGADAQDYSAA